MPLPCYLVDAFAEAPGEGNPAAVVLLDGNSAGLGDAELLRIARVLGRSETAFVSLGAAVPTIRWFSPVREMPVCGHATLAAAAVLHDRQAAPLQLSFDSAAGRLTVEALGSGAYSMDFPLDRYERIPVDAACRGFFGLAEDEVIDCIRGLTTGKVVLVLRPGIPLRAVMPDYRAMKASSGLHTKGIGLTQGAKGHDFETRYFNPWAGVDEDPVTGSVHLVLAAYWAELLGKSRLLAYQASARGGFLGLELKGHRVAVSGKAQLVLRGELAC